MPIWRPGSLALEERIRFFKRKFASIAIISRYRNLYTLKFRKNLQSHNTHFHSTPTSSQLSGRFTPGIGQAGQPSARSPAPVKRSPPAMFPRPARFISLRWRNIRTIRISDLYRVLVTENQMSEKTKMGNIPWGRSTPCCPSCTPSLCKTRVQRVYLPV